MNDAAATRDAVESVRLADFWRKRRAARVAAGMCPTCGARLPAPFRKSCRPCLKKACRRVARAYALRVRRGLCGKCGRRPPLRGISRCRECLQAQYASKVKGREARRA